MRFCLALFLPLLSFAGPSDASLPVLVRDGLKLAGNRQFEPALTALRTALDRARADSRTQWMSSILNDIGTVLQEQGKFYDAERYYRQAIDEAERVGGAPASEASALGNLGSLYYEAGQYTKAVDFMNQSLEVLKAGKVGGVMMAKGLTNLGVVYVAQHKDAAAESSAQDAIRLWTAQEGPDGPSMAFSYSVLGAALNHENRIDQAEPALRHALEIWTNHYGENDVRTAKGKVNLGALYVEDGHPEKAKPYFDQARPVLVGAKVNDRFVLHFLDMDAALEKKLGHGRQAKNVLHQLDRLQAANEIHAMAGNVIDVSGFAGR